MAEIPSDAHLKEVRDEMVGELADQGRRMGAVLPEIRKIEKFIDPIMRRVEVDAEREARMPESPAPVPERPDRTVKQGEWYGEEGHSPLIGGPSSMIKEGRGEASNAEVRSEGLGEYKRGPDGKLRPVNGAPMPKGASFLELVIKKMMQLPDWRAQILAANKLCDRHLSAMPGCTPCERRETRLLEIVGKARTTFTKQRERRITVGGK